MRYVVTKLNLEAGKPIAFIHYRDAKRLGVHAGDRVAIKALRHQAIAVVDITTNFIRRGSVGLSQEIIRYLRIAPRAPVNIEPLRTPQSSILLKNNHQCAPYTRDQLKKIIRDIVHGALTEAEIAYFISGVNYCTMSLSETKYLIDAIVSTGRKLSWGRVQVADKHSIGGIPGNRTTPIIVAICAAGGVVMPKTSSRAITSAAGTADTIETVARVDFSIPELKAIVRKTGACLAWGGALGLAPADDKLIQIEKMLNLDPEPQLLASILAKKVAVGSHYVLIDIPYGLGAKVSKEKALDLKKKFIVLARSLGLTLAVIITKGSEPIGNGIGPALEMRDVLRVLTRDNAPLDLERKSIVLAGKIFELTKKAKPGKGWRLAKKILNDGSALAKFKEIIAAQDGNLSSLPEASHKKTIFAPRAGRIALINNKLINMLARIAGCPQDKAAGIYLHVHTKAKVAKGDPLFTLHAESRFKLKAAEAFLVENNPLELQS